MDIFTQKKLLVRGLIILSFLNLLIIGVFIWKEVNHHKGPPMFRGGNFRDVSGILQKELNMTQKQAENVRKIRNDFFKKEMDVQRIIRSERDSMNEEMFNKNTDEMLVKSLARRVSENEYQMELLRFEQARAFKSVFTPEQLEKFESLVIEIRDYFRPDNQPQRP